MLKFWINNVVRMTGYQLTRTPSASRDIASGKYEWLRARNIATVLDIGANEGQFAEVVRQIFPHALIHSFEPLSTCYEKLQSKAASLMPMRCFPFAIGREDTDSVIYHNEFSPSSSLLPMGNKHREAFPFAQKTIRENIVVRSMDSVAAELELKPPIMMKVDVQGSELDVLTGARKILPSIDTIIIEASFVELYQGQALFDEIYDNLHSRGFRFMGSLEQVMDPSNGAILQADCIFARA